MKQLTTLDGGEWKHTGESHIAFKWFFTKQPTATLCCKQFLQKRKTVQAATACDYNSPPSRALWIMTSIWTAQLMWFKTKNLKRERKNHCIDYFSSMSFLLSQLFWKKLATIFEAEELKWNLQWIYKRQWILIESRAEDINATEGDELLPSSYGCEFNCM